MSEELHPIRDFWEAYVPQSFRQISASISVGLFCYLVNYLSSVVVSRVLGQPVFGDYSATVSALWLIAAVVPLGKDSGLGRFVPRYLAEQDYAGIRGYLRYSANSLYLINGVLFGVGMLAMVVLYRLTGEHILNIKHTHPFYFCVWAVPLAVGLTVVAKYIRATGHGIFQILISNAIRPALLLAMILFFLIFIRKFTLTEALLIRFFATFVTIAIGVLFAYKKTALSAIKKVAPRFELGTWAVVTRELFLQSMSTSYLGTIFMIIAAVFDKGENRLGLMAAVLAVCNIMWMISSSVGAIAGPKISVAVAKLDKENIRKLVLNSVAANAAVNGVVFLVMVMWGRGWMGHFGPDYGAAYPYLLMLGGTVLVTTIASPLGWELQQSNQLADYTRFSMILFGVYVVGSCACSAVIGTRGAFLAYNFVLLVSVVYLVFKALKRRRLAFAR